MQINAASDKATGNVITSKEAKGNVLLEGTRVQSGGDALIYAGNDLLITAAVEESYQHSETRREYSSGVSNAKKTTTADTHNL